MKKGGTLKYGILHLYSIVQSLGKPYRWIIFSGYATLIGLLSLSRYAPPMEHESDKLAHFLAYSGFALLAIIVVRTKAQYLICCLLICLYGGSLEFIQSLIPHRSMSFADVFANCIGVAAGYLLVKTHLSGPEFNT